MLKDKVQYGETKQASEQDSDMERVFEIMRIRI